MSRPLVFIAAALALPGLVAGTAYAQATAETAAAAEAEAVAAEAEADVAQDAAAEAQATADTTQDAGDAQAAADAQTEADAAQEAANLAEAAAADEAAAASAFRGGIRSIRILKNLSQEHLAEAIVGDDTMGEVTSIKMVFDGSSDSTVVAPAPLQSSYILKRSGTGYDANGKLAIADDGAGQPVWDAPYDLTFALTDSNGVTSSPFVLTGIPVGEFYKVTGPPIIFDGTAYGLESVDWSQSPDCYGCPIISLVDLIDDSDVVGLDSVPKLVSLTADPVSTVIVDSFQASFESFATTATFSDATLDFDADALGFEYAVTASMFAGDIPVGEPAQFKVLVEEDDTTEPEPEPVPTLVIDSNLSGSVSVGDGEYVVLQAQVGRNITVKEGGTLLIQGGVIGRDLKLNGGEVILADATIGRNLKARGGIIEVGEAVIGRDLEIKGGVEMLGDSQSFLVVGRNLRGRTSDSVVLGGNIDVLERVHLRAGDLIVNDTLSAEGDVDLRTRGNTDGGLVVNGDISADYGEIEMRTKGAGGLSINGTVDAQGEVNLRTRRGGDLSISGSVSASEGEISMRVRGDSDLSISGDVSAAGDIDMRVRDGGAVIDGTVYSLGIIDLNSGTTTEVNGNVTSQGLIDLNSGTDTTVNGSVSAQGDVTLDSGGSTDVDGTVTAQGIIDLTSGTDLTVNGNVQASVTPGATFGISSVAISVRSAAINGSVSGSGDVVIDATTTLSVDGDVTSQGDISFDAGTSTEVNGTVTATGHIGLLGTPTIVMGSSDIFDYRISGDQGVTIDASATVELTGGTIESPNGITTISATFVILAESSVEMVEGVLNRVAGAGGVDITAAQELELSGVLIESSEGDIDLLASSFRKNHDVPLDVPDTEFDAYGSITVEGTDYFELFGTYTWGAGAYSVQIDPTEVFASGGRLNLDPIIHQLTDPGALLAAVTGG